MKFLFLGGIIFCFDWVEVIGIFEFGFGIDFLVFFIVFGICLEGFMVGI